MEKQLNLQDSLQKLLRVRSYINKERFVSIYKNLNITDWRKQFEEMNQSFIYYLSNADSKVIYELIELDSKIQNNSLFKIVFNQPESLKKIIFKGGYKIMDISTLEGLQELVLLHEEEDDVKMLRFSDTLEMHKIKTNIFEGDLIKCWDKWNNKTTMILSVFDDNYINPQPYYLELLYTEKYGYLKNNDNPNTDNEKLKFDTSIFNIKDNHYNYHVITLTEKWEIVGNIFLDYSVLYPII